MCGSRDSRCGAVCQRTATKVNQSFLIVLQGLVKFVLGLRRCDLAILYVQSVAGAALAFP
jgi:hypothetical protein